MVAAAATTGALPPATHSHHARPASRVFARCSTLPRTRKAGSGKGGKVSMYEAAVASECGRVGCAGGKWCLEACARPAGSSMCARTAGPYSQPTPSCIRRLPPLAALLPAARGGGCGCCSRAALEPILDQIEAAQEARRTMKRQLDSAREEEEEDLESEEETDEEEEAAATGKKDKKKASRGDGGDDDDAEEDDDDNDGDDEGDDASDYSSDGWDGNDDTDDDDPLASWRINGMIPHCRMSALYPVIACMNHS